MTNNLGIPEVTLDVDYEARPREITHGGKTLINSGGCHSLGVAEVELRIYQKTDPGKKLVLAKVTSYALYIERD
jgi:hypothetical protein